MPAVEHVQTITRLPAAEVKSSPSAQQYGRIQSTILCNTHHFMHCNNNLIKHAHSLVNPFNAQLFKFAAVQRVQRHTGQTNHFYRASICEGVLASRNSVCPSVSLSHAWIVTKLNDALQIFLYHTKGQSLCYSDTKSGWSATPPSR